MRKCQMTLAVKTLVVKTLVVKTLVVKTPDNRRLLVVRCNVRHQRQILHQPAALTLFTTGIGVRIVREHILW